MHGDWRTRFTKGLWTWQKGGYSSVIDYGVISTEHLNSVVSMEIDVRGENGTNSDHNWIFLTLSDKFIQQSRSSNHPIKKDSWNIAEDQDWTNY